MTSVVLQDFEKPKSGCKEGMLLHSAGGHWALMMGAGSREQAERDRREYRSLFEEQCRKEETDSCRRGVRTRKTSFIGGRNKGTVVGECVLVYREQNTDTAGAGQTGKGLQGTG